MSEANKSKSLLRVDDIHVYYGSIMPSRASPSR